MQDDFRNILLIIVLALIALIFLHSLFSMRKKNKIKSKPKGKRKGASKIVVPEREEEKADNPEIISEVRVRAKNKSEPPQDVSDTVLEQETEQAPIAVDQSIIDELNRQAAELEAAIEDVNEEEIETLVEIDVDIETEGTDIEQGNVPFSNTIPASVLDEFGVNVDGFASVDSEQQQSQTPQAQSAKEEFMQRQQSLFDEEGTVDSKQQQPEPKSAVEPKPKKAEPKREQKQHEKPQQKPATEKPKAPDLQIVFFIAAKQNQSIHGQQLMDVLTTHHLRFGEYKIFHRYDETEDNSLFCVANAMNPGHFSIKSMPMERFQALCLIMSLPNGSEDPKAILDEMLNLAREISESCDAIVLDDQKVELTPQIIELYKEQIAEYQLKQRYKK